MTIRTLTDFLLALPTSYGDAPVIVRVGANTVRPDLIVAPTLFEVLTQGAGLELVAPPPGPDTPGFPFEAAAPSPN